MPRAARWISIVAATAVSLTLLAYPFAFGPRLDSEARLGVTILLVGVCAAFVHGFGYVPRNRAWRFLFGPLAAWPLMLTGAILALNSDGR